MDWRQKTDAEDKMEMKMVEIDGDEQVPDLRRVDLWTHVGCGGAGAGALYPCVPVPKDPVFSR